MNQDTIKHIIRWSARLVTLLGYIITCGMLLGGLALIAVSLVMLLFTQRGGPLVCMLCGTAFAGLGAITLIRQLRGQATELRHSLQSL